MLEEVLFYCLHLPLGNCRPVLTHSDFDIFCTVNIFYSSEDTGVCRTGILISSLKSPTNGCHELRLNVSGYILNFSFNQNAAISIFFF